MSDSLRPHGLHPSLSPGVCRAEKGRSKYRVEGSLRKCICSSVQIRTCPCLPILQVATCMQYLPIRSEKSIRQEIPNMARTLYYYFSAHRETKFQGNIILKYFLTYIYLKAIPFGISDSFRDFNFKKLPPTDE